MILRRWTLYFWVGLTAAVLYESWAQRQAWYARAERVRRLRYFIFTGVPSAIGRQWDTALAGARWIFGIPGHTARHVQKIPKRVNHWAIGLPWERMLTIRKGFLLGAFIGFLLATSTLRAISTLPYLAGRPVEPMLPPQMHEMPPPVVRASVPAELAWFFIQYPFVSESAVIHQKNHHTFVIDDTPRQRDYVVMLGQRFRRVELYSLTDKSNVQIVIYTPGARKVVMIEKGRIVSKTTGTDGNLWMWKGPLWNPLHLKIYSMADLWLDSPFKRYSCAGFVQKFLHEAGVQVPILDAWDMAKQPWKQIPVEEMEPGDVITIRALTAEHRRFWHHSITHVGVYIGHGKMIHASSGPNSKRAWIRISDVEEFHGRIAKVLRPPELL